MPELIVVSACLLDICRGADARKYHTFNNPITGQPTFFVPSGITSCLQYVAALSIRAGLNPVYVGSHNSGRRTLLQHLIATSELHRQLK